MSNKCKDIKEQYDALTIQTDQFMRVFESEKASGVFVHTRKLMKSLAEAKENLEDKISFEGQALDYLESLSPKLAPLNLARYLSGFKSKRVQKIRQNLIDGGVEIMYILFGLQGDDSKEAWKIRDSISKDKNPSSYIRSLGGIDSPKAMKIRQEYVNRGEFLDHVLLSLAGLDSKSVKMMRKELKKKVADKTFYIFSLTGLQSDESIDERRANFNNVNIEHIALSLIGTDPLMLKDFRMECAENGAKKGLLESLAGSDSRYAWEQRELALSEPRTDHLDASIAKSLAGLNTPKAWAMRKRLEERGVSSLTLASSLAGDLFSFLGWFLKQKNKVKKAA